MGECDEKKNANKRIQQVLGNLCGGGYGVGLAADSPSSNQLASEQLLYIKHMMGVSAGKQLCLATNILLYRHAIS
jgi:hypothetical protein